MNKTNQILHFTLNFISTLLLQFVIFSCSPKTDKETSKTTIRDSFRDSIELNNKANYILPKVEDILAKFNEQEFPNKFDEIEELPDSVIELSSDEAHILKLDVDLTKDAIPYAKWYIIGKSQYKNFFSLLVFQTVESVEVYQLNYSKKDSSFIQKFLLSDWSNPCEEFSSTKTERIGDKYRKTRDNFYQEWSNNKGLQIHETIITDYEVRDNGKIDSISSVEKIIKKSLKE